MIWDCLTDPAHWTGSDGMPARVLEHLAYSFVALALAALIAAAARAVGRAHRPRPLRRSPARANALRALPTWACCSSSCCWSRGTPARATLAYVVPTLLVLVILAVPPILVGDYAGVAGVDPAARDAARGMGMRGTQVLGGSRCPARCR